VNGKEISKTKIGLSHNYKPECMDDLEKILKLLNDATLCQGVGSIKKYEDIESSFGPKFEKLLDEWHHSNCTIIVTKTQFSRSR